MAIIRNTNITDFPDLIFYLDAVNSKSYPGSGSTWYDLTANKNHFTLYNTPTYTSNGTTGTYLSFNGTNQYARSTNAINFNAYSAVTIEIGYRTTNTSTTQILYETTGTGASTATGGITLLMNANSTGTVGNIYLSQWQGYGPRMFGYTASTNTAFNSVVEQFVNAVDSTGRQTYVNGTLATYFTNTSVISTATTTTSGLAFANTWTYIASRVGTSNFFGGDIAYVRAWGKKLSSTNLNISVNGTTVRQSNSYQNATILTYDPQASGPPPPPTLTFLSGTNRTMSGYAPNGRSGWTLGSLTPTSYDDGSAGPYTSVMPAATNWYMNNTAYNSYYVSSNGYLTFGGGSGSIISAPQTVTGFYFNPGDNYWSQNGANSGTNTPQGFAYRYGVTSNGFNFFSANLMAYAFGNVANDLGWELNCFWNADNSSQWVEFVWSPAFGSWSGSFGIYTGLTTYSVSNTTFQPAANKSYGWSSTDKGITWTNNGNGSWTGMGTF